MGGFIAKVMCTLHCHLKWLGGHQKPYSVLGVFRYFLRRHASAHQNRYILGQSRVLAVGAFILLLGNVQPLFEELVRDASPQFWLTILAVIIAILAITVSAIFISRMQTWKKIQTGRISKVPGAQLLAIVDFLFSPTAVEETFKPTVADWHKEYFEALSQKRFLKAVDKRPLHLPVHSGDGPEQSLFRH